MIFSPEAELLTCASANTNCIRQLRINRNDNKILTLCRERVGLRDNVTKCNISSNNDIVLESDNNTMFMSLYSHSNNYMLPKCLDSKLPTHIAAKNFNV